MSASPIVHANAARSDGAIVGYTAAAVLFVVVVVCVVLCCVHCARERAEAARNRVAVAAPVSAWTGMPLATQSIGMLVAGKSTAPASAGGLVSAV